jgi:hypothetical protein
MRKNITCNKFLKNRVKYNQTVNKSPTFQTMSMQYHQSITVFQSWQQTSFKCTPSKNSRYIFNGINITACGWILYTVAELNNGSNIRIKGTHIYFNIAAFKCMQYTVGYAIGFLGHIQNMFMP